jgi:hypothetical protein
MGFDLGCWALVACAGFAGWWFLVYLGGLSFIVSDEGYCWLGG